MLHRHLTLVLGSLFVFTLCLLALPGCGPGPDSNPTPTPTPTTTLLPNNQAPVVTDHSASTTKNTAKDITLSGTDSDNDPLTFSIVANPSHGTLTKKSDTVYTYTPATDYIGSDTFTCKANDGKADSNTAAVNITIIGDTITIDCGGGVLMTLVKIPAGSVQMGTNSTDYSWLDFSRPVHQVTISQAFYMGKYEVTQEQYQAVMGTNPSWFTGDVKYPVECVSWNDAVAFCQTLAAKSGYTIRLPSEAEWEYACKADKGNVDTKYSFGDDESQLGDYAWYWTNSNSTPHPVGQKLPNSFGLYDMAGNVWEWCQDWWHDNYSGAPTDGSAWVSPSGSYRVLRGGAGDSFDGDCRSARRDRDTPTYSDGLIGFRVVSGN